MTDSQRFHALGQAVGLWNFRQAKKPLTPGAVGNIFSAPHTLPVAVRHVWAQMVADDDIRGLIELSEYETLRSVGPANASFYLGYYAGLSGQTVAAGTLAETRAGRLQAAIERAGISPAELSRRLNVTEQRINNVLGGRSEVRLDWLVTAAAAIGCPGSELDEALSSQVPTPA